MEFYQSLFLELFPMPRLECSFSVKEANGKMKCNGSYKFSFDNRDQIKKDYDEHFAKGCSKSLACEKVCPMKIPTLASIAKMNKGL